jgi:hypothetical protein
MASWLRHFMASWLRGFVTSWFRGFVASWLAVSKSKEEFAPLRASKTNQTLSLRFFSNGSDNFGFLATPSAVGRSFLFPLVAQEATSSAWSLMSFIDFAVNVATMFDGFHFGHFLFEFVHFSSYMTKQF